MNVVHGSAAPLYSPASARSQPFLAHTPLDMLLRIPFSLTLLCYYLPYVNSQCSHALGRQWIPRISRVRQQGIHPGIISFPHV